MFRALTTDHALLPRPLVVDGHVDEALTRVGSYVESER